MKHRMTFRGTAVAVGLLAAAGGITASMTGGAVVSSAAPAVVPTSAKLALIEQRQGQLAGRDNADRASRSDSRTMSVKNAARSVAARVAAERYGWGRAQFACLDSLWTRESGWDPRAVNPASGAHGIPQAMPGAKMSVHGTDWRTNPVTQITWGLAYIRDSHGTPCQAWQTLRSQGSY